MPSYNDDLIYNNATDGEVYLEAPNNSEGEEGAETWRFISDKGLYHFKKYNGQWMSRRYSPGVETASSEFSQTIINSSEIDVQSGDIYDLNVTNSLTFSGTSLSLYSFSSPLSLNNTNQAVSLPYSGNLQITSNQLDTIQGITTDASPTFKNLTISQVGGTGGSISIDENINGINVNVLLGEHGKLFSTNYVDGTGTSQTDGIGLGALTAAEVDQLENIGTNEISNQEWSYLANLDQSLTQTSNVIFNAVATGTLSFVDALSVSTSTTNNTAPINFVDKLNLNNTGYTSGFLGDGWSIYNKLNSDNTTTGKYVAEVDDLIVRGSMNVHELVINQIRATNGALIVSDAGKVADKGFVRHANNNYQATLKFDTDVVGGVAKPAPFAVGDLILHRRVQTSDNSIVVNEAKFYVHTINVDSDPTKITVYFNDISPTIANTKGCIAIINGTEQTYSSNEVSTDWDGATFVRAGSRSNTDRQGLVLITSQDSQAPFIDVIDGVTSWEIWDGVTGNIEISNGNFDNLPSTGSVLTGSDIPNWTISTGTNVGAYAFASGGIGGGQYIGLRDGQGNTQGFLSQDINYSQFYDGVTYVLEFYAKKNTSNATLSVYLGSTSNFWNESSSAWQSGNAGYTPITDLGAFDSSWRKYKLEFTANAALSTDTDAEIKFMSHGGDTEEVGLDSIRMYAKDKVKVRLGNLEGVGKNGYGLWGDNVYMDGRIEIAEGYIGNSENGWLLDATSITALGSNANISIPDTSGNTGYNSGGVYMSGHSTEVFSLGNTGSGNGLTWDGTNLNVSGNITIGNIGNINLSDFNNDLSISGGDYSRFHAFLNSSNGSNSVNGSIFFCGFDTDGNVSTSSNARFMLQNGTFISLSPAYISTWVYQNVNADMDANDGTSISQSNFRLHNDDGMGYILLDTVGDFGRTGGTARPTGSLISVNNSLSQRLVYVVYNASKNKWFYDDNTATDVTQFVPLSTDVIVSEVTTGAYGLNSAIVAGEPYFIAKPCGAIENFYQGINSGEQMVSWSYQNSSGWNMLHTNNAYSSNGSEFWHTIKEWNFPSIPDGGNTNYKVRITYNDFPEFVTNGLKLVINKGQSQEQSPGTGSGYIDQYTIGTLNENTLTSNNETITEVFDINSTFLETNEPLVIQLLSDDEAGNGTSADTGKVYLIEIYDGQTGAGLNDLFPVGDPNATGLFLGSDKIGYFNNTTNAWGVKIESNGNFFFGNTSGSSSNYVNWDGTTLSLRGLLEAGAVQSTSYGASQGTKIDLDGASMQMGGDGTSENAGHYWFEFDTEASISTMKWKRGNGTGNGQYDILEMGASITNYASTGGGVDIETVVDNSSFSSGEWTFQDNVQAAIPVDGIEVHQDDTSLTRSAIIKMGKDWNLNYPIFSGAYIGSKSSSVEGLALKIGYSPAFTLNNIYNELLALGPVLKRPTNRGTSGFTAKWETPYTSTLSDGYHQPFHSYLNIGADHNYSRVTNSEVLAYNTPVLDAFAPYVNNTTNEFQILYVEDTNSGWTKLDTAGQTFNLPQVMSDEATNAAHTNIGYAHYGDGGDNRCGKNIGFYAEIGSMGSSTSSNDNRADHDTSNHKTYKSLSFSEGANAGNRDGNWNTYDGSSWGSNNYGEMHVDEGENILTHCGVSIALLGFGAGNHPNFGHEYGVKVKKINATDNLNSPNITSNAGGHGSVEGTSVGDNTQGDTGDTNQKQNQRSIGVYTEVNAVQGQALLTRGNVSMLPDADGRGNLYLQIATYGSVHSPRLSIDNDSNYNDRGHATSTSSNRELKYDEKEINLDDASMEDFLTKLKPTLFKWKRNKNEPDDFFKGHYMDIWGRGHGDYSEGWKDDVYDIGFIAQDAASVNPRLAHYGGYTKYDENGNEVPSYHIEKTIEKGTFDKDGNPEKEEIKYPVFIDDRKDENGNYKAQVKDINERGIMAYQQAVIKRLWEKVKELESKIN